MIMIVCVCTCVELSQIERFMLAFSRNGGWRPLLIAFRAEITEISIIRRWRCVFAKVKVKSVFLNHLSIYSPQQRFLNLAEYKIRKTRARERESAKSNQRERGLKGKIHYDKLPFSDR
jgi:hypothetical protein